MPLINGRPAYSVRIVWQETFYEYGNVIIWNAIGFCELLNPKRWICIRPRLRKSKMKLHEPDSWAIRWSAGNESDRWNRMDREIGAGKSICTPSTYYTYAAHCLHASIYCMCSLWRPTVNALSGAFISFRVLRFSLTPSLCSSSLSLSPLRLLLLQCCFVLFFFFAYIFLFFFFFMLFLSTSFYSQRIVFDAKWNGKKCAHN